MLNQYLIRKTKEKTTFSLRELKKKFPEDKEQIGTFHFVGLIEPVSIEFPDLVRAYVYSDSKQ